MILRRASLRITYRTPPLASYGPAYYSLRVPYCFARSKSSARQSGDDTGLVYKSNLNVQPESGAITAVSAAEEPRSKAVATDSDFVFSIPRPVHDEPTATPKSSFWQTAWKLVGYLGWDAAVLVIAAGLAVAAAALGVVGPIAVGKLWEAFSSPAADGLTGPAAQLLATYVGRFILQWLSTSLVGTATENAACRLREAVFASLLEMDLSFYDEHSSAGFAGPLADDVKELRDALRTAISDGLPAVVRCVGSIVSMTYISPTLAVALGCGIPAAAYLGSEYAARLRSLSRKSQEAQSRAAAISAEGLANIRTVRAFTAEKHQREQYHSAVSEYSKLNKQLGMEITLFNSTISMGMSVLAGIVLLYGGQMVQVSQCARNVGGS